MKTTKWIILFFIFSTWISTKAQNLCNDANAEKGSFTVTPNIGVEPLNPITITDNSGGTNVAYFFNYQAGMTFDFVNNPANGKLVQTSATTSGITQLRFAGTYQILQFGTKNGRRMYACRTVEILPAGDPEFGYSECSLQFFELNIPNTPINRKFSSFKVYWNGVVENIPPTEPLPIVRNRNIPVGSTVNIRVEGIMDVNGTPISLTTTKAITLSGQRPEPKIQKIETKNDGSAIITYAGDPGIIYNVSTPPISIAGGRINLTQLQKASGNPIKISGLNTQASTVLMLHHIVSPCSDNRLSNPVPAIFLTKAIHQNNNAQLEWTGHPSATSYIVHREINGVPQADVTATSPSYQEPMPCNQRYCYQIEAVTTASAVGTTISYNVPGSISGLTARSLTEKTCITPDKPASPINALVSIDNNAVKFEVLNNIIPPPISYTLYRAEDGNPPFIKLNNQPSKQFTDNSINPSQKRYCYQVTYTNDCNRESEPSANYCPIFLQLDNGIKLLWTDYQEFTFNNDNIVKYTLEQLDPSKNVIASTDLGLSLDFEERPQNIVDGFYRIKTVSKNGLTTYSNLVETFAFPKMLLPEAFTPNNDTENDDFKVYGSLGRITEFKLDIYNRWGILIYTLNDKSATWDGKVDGTDAPTGIYQYRINAKLVTGEIIEKKGNVILLR